MNSKIIEQFELLVRKNQQELNDAIESKDKKEANKYTFKLRTNKRILGIMKKYPEEITLENYKDLQELGGIGKGTIDKLKQILENGYIDELKGMKKTENKKELALIELEKVINIGRSKALELVGQGVTSIEDLEKKIKSGKIEVNDKVKLGLKYYNKMQERIPRSEIDEINDFLQDKVNKLNKDEKNKYILQIAGSYRRQKPTSGDIDVLITKKGTTEKSKKLDEHLIKMVTLLKKKWKKNNDQHFLIDDMTDKEIHTKYMGFFKWKDSLPGRIDIRFVSYDSYYTALLYFTGSGEFNKVMRNIAKEKGYKLSEYALTEIDSDKKIKINSEKDVFDKLGMDYLEPHLR